MKHKSEITWKHDLVFESSTLGFKFTFDTSPDAEGKSEGPLPKNMLLAALGGCTGINIMAILKKMEVKPDYFNVEVEAEPVETSPKVYPVIRIRYVFRGKDLPKDRIEWAISLAEEKYCAVTAMLSKSAKIEHEIVIEE
jgi:putative redox protein